MVESLTAFAVLFLQSIAVAGCESTFDLQAISRTNDYGLFQINRIHERRVTAMGYRWSQMLELRPNADVAFAIYREQGWRPWSCRPR